MGERAPGTGPGPGRGPDPDLEDQRVMLAVPMHASMIERIDVEVAVESKRSGGDYTRDQFVRHAVVELIDRLRKQRHAERQRGERDG